MCQTCGCTVTPGDAHVPLNPAAGKAALPEATLAAAARRYGVGLRPCV